MMIEVKSSNLLAIGYKEDTKILYIKFKNGIYKYIDVSKYIYQEILNAESKGKYFSQNIKTKFSFLRVDHLDEKTLEENAQCPSCGFPITSKHDLGRCQFCKKITCSNCAKSVSTCKVCDQDPNASLNFND